MQVEQRGQAQPVGHQAVTEFLGCVRRDQVVSHLRVERHRDDGCRSGDKTVYNHRASVGGSAQDGPGQPANLEPADFGEQVKPIRRVGLVDLQGALDGRDFAFQAPVIHAGAAPGNLADGFASNSRGDGGGRGGVADAHIAGGEQVQAVGNFGFDDFRTSQEAGFGLLARHGRANGNIGSAGRDLADEQLRVRLHRGGRAHIHNDDARANVPRQHVDGCATVQEVQNHLRGDFLRVGADALGDDSVVARHDGDNFVLDLWPRLAGNPGNLDG